MIVDSGAAMSTMSLEQWLKIERCLKPEGWNQFKTRKIKTKGTSKRREHLNVVHRGK